MSLPHTLSHLPCCPWERLVDFLRFFGTQLEDSNARWLVALAALTASQLWFLWPVAWMSNSSLALDEESYGTQDSQHWNGKVPGKLSRTGYPACVLPKPFLHTLEKGKALHYDSQEGKLGHSAVRTHHKWVLPELSEQQFERLIECSFSCSLCSFVFALLVLFVLFTILQWLPLPQKKDHMAEKQTEH